MTDVGGVSFAMSPDGRSVYIRRMESEADIWVGTFR
jgi:hypothetical protein